MTTLADDIDEAIASLSTRGVAHLRVTHARRVAQLVERVGTTIRVDDVVVDHHARALLKSDAAIGLHTDHHRARAIVWHCVAQSSEGGETILVDGFAAFSALSAKTQSILATVELQEHSVFDGDIGRHPLVTKRRGERALYYSLWLVDKLNEAQRASVEEYESALTAAPQLRLRLRPGEVLVIDNRRMLHGRTAIVGDRQRHLRRFWVA